MASLPEPRLNGVSAARRTRLIGANQLLLRAEIEPIGCFIFDVAGGGLPRKPFPDQSFLGAGARCQLVGVIFPPTRSALNNPNRTPKSTAALIAVAPRSPSIFPRYAFKVGDVGTTLD